MRAEAPSDVVWRPTPDLAANCQLARFMTAVGVGDFPELVRRADADPAWFWDTVIRERKLTFIKPYNRVLNLSRGLPWPQWCVDGVTNVCLNALDRHLAGDLADKEALVWEGEAGDRISLTYRELGQKVRHLAASLASLGLRAGDPIGLHMAMTPDAIAAYLAIARIGGIVLPLFSGFGAVAIETRLNDAEAVAVVASDGCWRRGQWVAMKSTLDTAAQHVASLRHIVVFRSGDGFVPMLAGRDVWASDIKPDLNDVLAPVPAEHPLMIIYTSGTTGRPKGTVHTHCGFSAKMALDMELCLDVRSQDRILWMTDMGWLVGPMLAVGPMQAGATVILAEGTPDWPSADRIWKLVADHRVTALGLAPTVVRALMQHGAEPVRKHDLSSLTRTFSTGEPWTPEAWTWFFEHVCRTRIPILNYSGGTEIGGAIVTGTVLHPLKPCSFGGPVPGMGADIVDESGHPVPPGEVGELVLRVPSIGNTRGLWRDPERYLDTYWRKIPGMWVHGDFAMKDQDGFWYIYGRSDDTIKVAGKRVGPTEIEALLMATGLAADAAAIAIPDPIKGAAVVCVCVPTAQAAGASAAERLAAAVVQGLGPAFRPKDVLLVSDLPKTRNMKVMRRVVRAAYLDQPPGDLSAIVNPSSVTEIAAARTKAGAGASVVAKQGG
jgi:acetyl-CoA synthetase